MDEVLSTAVVVEDSKEKCTISGSCNLCGKCCQPPQMVYKPFLLDYKMDENDIVISGKCKYLSIEQDGLSPCKLFLAEASGELDKYPKEDVDYWERCCKKWPSYDGTVTIETLKIMIERGFPEECGYILDLTVKEEADEK